MRNNQPSQQEQHTITIPEAEEIVEQALSDLAFSTDPGVHRALAYLAPAGYEAIVEFCSGDGRSKRRNATASAWSPEEDEIRIYFQRIEDEDGEVAAPAPRAARPAAAKPAAAVAAVHDEEDLDDVDGNSLGEEAILNADMDARVKELTAALAEAERGGHAFIALKWFRDSFLPRKAFRWNQRPESRQAVLAEAIQRGIVITSKIPNPKTPAYPTTTIRLNRAEAGLAEEAQRFRPVAIGGEGLTSALSEDRG